MVKPRKDSNRRSVFLSDTALAVLGEPESLSGRLNSVVIRYGNIIAAECPELAEAEWLLICDMLNATVMDADHRDTDPARYLWVDIGEAGQLDGLAEKWGVDTAALSDRVKAMRLAERIAILEVVGRFWRSPNLNKDDTQKILAESGAKIA